MTKVTDEVIRKIIYDIALFSPEVRTLLNRLSPQQSEKLNADSIDLTKIDINFVDVMLNILERYELVKLCLILCNKFGHY